MLKGGLESNKFCFTCADERASKKTKYLLFTAVISKINIELAAMETGLLSIVDV